MSKVSINQLIKEDYLIQDDDGSCEVADNCIIKYKDEIVIDVSSYGKGSDITTMQGEDHFGEYDIPNNNKDIELEVYVKIDFN